jgi:hypothetical protein
MCSPSGQEEFFLEIGNRVPDRTAPPPNPGEAEQRSGRSVPQPWRRSTGLSYSRLRRERRVTSDELSHQEGASCSRPTACHPLCARQARP